MEDIIKSVIEKISSSHGDDFLDNISHAFIESIDADYVFISEVEKDLINARTISLVTPGQSCPNIIYELKDTPCSNVLENKVCCYPENVCLLFPLDHLLVDMGVSGYIGTPLLDSKGVVTGIIVALFKEPISNEDLVTTLFKLFSGRISAELDRKKYEDELVRVNENLEHMVNERTKELTSALTILESAKNQIVESEKMAALGKLVAGISHEVNTPLGIAITSHSILIEDVNSLNDKILDNKLRKSDLIDFCLKSKDVLHLQGSNLNRSKELIDDFKKTAVETSALEIEKIDVTEYYNRIANIMKGYLNETDAAIEVNSSVREAVHTYPGLHNQIITNLINNSCVHGFRGMISDKKIVINISSNKDHVIVEYKDNGVGVSSKDFKRIFEPFYTTARNIGGSGLGLSVLFNIVTQKLNGSIKMIESENGFHMKFTFENK